LSQIGKWPFIECRHQRFEVLVLNHICFVFLKLILKGLSKQQCVSYSSFKNVYCRTSMRQIAIYDVDDLSSALHKIDLNTSPSILIPHYDEDSSILFATGRASTVVALMY